MQKKENYVTGQFLGCSNVLTKFEASNSFVAPQLLAFHKVWGKFRNNFRYDFVDSFKNNLEDNFRTILGTFL